MLRFLYKHQAQLLPADFKQDRAGGERLGFVPGVAPLPCRLQQDDDYDRTDGQSRHKATGKVSIFFPRDPGVNVRDRLVVLAGGRARIVVADGPAVDRSGSADSPGMAGAATTWKLTAREQV